MRIGEMLGRGRRELQPRPGAVPIPGPGQSPSIRTRMRTRMPFRARPRMRMPASRKARDTTRLFQYLDGLVAAPDSQGGLMRTLLFLSFFYLAVPTFAADWSEWRG